MSRGEKLLDKPERSSYNEPRTEEIWKNGKESYKFGRKKVQDRNGKKAVYH